MDINAGICDGISHLIGLPLYQTNAGEHIELFRPNDSSLYFWDTEDDKESRLNALALMIAMTED